MPCPTVPAVVRYRYCAQVNLAFDVLLGERRERDGVVEIRIRVEDHGARLRALTAFALNGSSGSRGND